VIKITSGQLSGRRSRLPARPCSEPAFQILRREIFWFEDSKQRWALRHLRTWIGEHWSPLCHLPNEGEIGPSCASPITTVGTWRLSGFVVGSLDPGFFSSRENWPFCVTRNFLPLPEPQRAPPGLEVRGSEDGRARLFFRNSPKGIWSSPWSTGLAVSGYPKIATKRVRTGSCVFLEFANYSAYFRFRFEQAFLVSRYLGSENFVGLSVGYCSFSSSVRSATTAGQGPKAGRKLRFSTMPPSCLEIQALGELPGGQVMPILRDRLSK